MYMSQRRNRAFILFLSLLFSVLFTAPAFPQCCSTGSPVGASTNVGVIPRNTLRFIVAYRYSYSDTYYQGNSKTSENVALSYANYNFTGLTLGYGITRRLTLEADFGYFFNKTQQFKKIDYAETGYGLSNGGVTLKYGFYIKPAKAIELMAGAGFRYPFTTTPQSKDGVQLSPDVQPSTHAFGLSGLFFFSKGWPELTLRLFSINKYDYNFPDKDNYKYGNILMNSVFVSKKIVKNLFGILQLRSEYKTQDTYEGEKRLDTGYLLFTLTPQVSYAIAGKWNVSVLYDLPVYKDYHGKQLTPKFSFAVSLSHDFDLSKHPKASPVAM
jgi:hypothetical protein